MLRYYGLKKDLFTNGCKKTLKFVQNVEKITQGKEVLEMELIDIFVIIVQHGLALNEDQKTYKKSSLKNIFIKDKY